MRGQPLSALLTCRSRPQDALPAGPARRQARALEVRDARSRGPLTESALYIELYASFPLSHRVLSLPGHPFAPRHRVARDVPVEFARSLTSSAYWSVDKHGRHERDRARRPVSARAPRLPSWRRLLTTTRSLSTCHLCSSFSESSRPRRPLSGRGRSPAHPHSTTSRASEAEIKTAYKVRLRPGATTAADCRMSASKLCWPWTDADAPRKPASKRIPTVCPPMLRTASAARRPSVSSRSQMPVRFLLAATLTPQITC